VFYDVGKVFESVRQIVSVWDRCEIGWGMMGQCWDSIVVDTVVFDTVVFEQYERVLNIKHPSPKKNCTQTSLSKQL
jgi:hypothetical protein